MSINLLFLGFYLFVFLNRRDNEEKTYYQYNDTLTAERRPAVVLDDIFRVLILINIVFSSNLPILR